ncbi:putative reverse transcriptase domain-containing protein [Tanacetum coccineum]
MANLPPPNNDLNVPKDEHAPAPEHAPIAPNPAPIQPNEYLADDDEEPEEEEEPIPEQSHDAPAGFSPQWIGWHDPNNNNGWIEEDDEEEVEAEKEDEEEMEDEEDEEMEVENNDDENDAEIIHPYEEADPLNRPPPSPETAEQEFMNAPVSQSTLQPILPIRQFTSTFYVGEGSLTTVFNHALCKFYPPRPMVNDTNTLYSRVKTLTKQMWDRFRFESSSFERLRRNDMRMDSFDDDLTALDSTLKEQIQEMKKLMAELNEQFQQIQERDLKAKNEMLRIRLRAAKERAELRNQLPLRRQYRETPYDPSANTTSRPRHDDPYVMVRDNAVCADAASDRGGESVDATAVVKDAREEKDNKGDNAAATKDSQSSESLQDGIEVAIRAERERVREEKLEVLLEAQRLENVATLGLEVANGKPLTEVKKMMIDEFCPIEEVQRLEDELRHLKLRDMNIAVYTERFNKLALFCLDAVPNEKKKVELYIKGLPKIIKGETTSSRPAMLNDVVCMAHTLMEQKIQAKNERIVEGNKRRWGNNNQGGINNRNNNDNRNNNNRNNRGNYRDNNCHNQYNQRR